MAVIFHDLPVGDRPLVRMPLQKVLVRFHHGSLDTLRDCFLFEDVSALHLSLHVSSSWGVDFSCEFGLLRLCDWKFFGRVMVDVVLAWAGWVWLLAC